MGDSVPEEPKNLHPCPGLLRAIVCKDGQLCPEVPDNPMGSGLTAGALKELFNREGRVCGPHRVVHYKPVAADA